MWLSIHFVVIIRNLISAALPLSRTYFMNFRSIRCTVLESTVQVDIYSTLVDLLVFYEVSYVRAAG